MRAPTWLYHAYVNKRDCIFLTSLSFACLIYRVSANEPKMGKEKQFFLTYILQIVFYFGNVF